MIEITKYDGPDFRGLEITYGSVIDARYPQRELTRREQFFALCLDWANRFKNAWLALKGYPIERD